RAWGTGHFLVPAAGRMAKRRAAVRAGEDEPSPREVQHALRDVVGRCVYGVDVNPMAVELCKVSLWMEAIEPGEHGREGPAGGPAGPRSGRPADPGGQRDVWGRAAGRGELQGAAAAHGGPTREAPLAGA